MEHSAITESGGTGRPFFMEHRWGQRIPCRAVVQLSAGAGISGTGQLRDVSSSGAFIETALDLSECTPVTLSVPGNDPATQPAEVAAIVVRTQADGVGVEWCDTPAGAVCPVLGCATRCGAAHR